MNYHKPVLIALIDGQQVPYDAASSDRDDDFHHAFEYLGRGRIYSVDGVRCTERTQKHFYTRKKTVERVSPTEQLRKRVEAAKESLPRNYRTIIKQRFPEYSSGKGASLLNNVINGRSTDVVLTEIIEALAREYSDGTFEMQFSVNPCN